MKPSQACIDLVKEFEGFRAAAYKCPAGVWTIGYGHTAAVEKDDEVTQQEAEELLTEDMKYVAECVEEWCEYDGLTQGMFDALCSFVFNLGCGNFRSSTLLRLLNHGDADAAAQQFARWNKAGGQVLAGLKRRREAERKLFLS